MKTLLFTLFIVYILSGNLAFGENIYSTVRAAAVISYSALQNKSEEVKPEPKPESNPDNGSKEEIVSKPKYTAIFFTAKTCGPCQLIKRHIDNNMRKVGWNEDILKVEDIDEPTELSAKYNVTPNSKIPYLVIVNEDKVIDSYLGGDYIVNGKVVDLSTYIKHVLRKNKVIE